MDKDKPKEKSVIEIHPERQEQIVVNRFYHDPEYRNILAEHYDARHFDCEMLGKAMSILVQYYKAYNKAPSKEILNMMLKRYCSNGKMNVKEIELKVASALDLNLTEDSQFVKDVVIDFVRSKSALFTIMDNVDMVIETKNVAAVVDSMSKILNIDFDQNLGMNYFDDVDQQKHWDDILNPEAKLPTLIQAFDGPTNGGVSKNGKCLIVAMASAGMGKSLWLSNITMNFCSQGKFIIIISLEMCEHVYATRMDAHISSEDINCLKFKHKEAREKIKSFEKLHPEAKLLIKDYPPDTISTATIVAYIDKVIQTHGRKPDAIVVDYINLLLPTRKKREENLYQKVGDVARELRAMSYKFEVPVFSVTQTNRGGLGNETSPTMENVSESSGISHTVDALCTIWQKEGDREASRLQLTWLKNRFGGCLGKTYELFINYNTLRITDMPKGESDERTEGNDTADLQRMLDNLNGV